MNNYTFPYGLDDCMRFYDDEVNIIEHYCPHQNKYVEAGECQLCEHPPEKYFIGYDQSSHQYLVPLRCKEEWDQWTELDEDDERSWDAPDYAVEFEGELLTLRIQN